ncbi:MAG: hypothetical protein U9Q66_04435, partial [Patescibacteria group bacterium]|nr:hypothetical protein [Patescibacteria group bacterium]
FGLTQEQILKVQIGYNVGKTLVASNGETFEKTIPSLLGQESSWGKYVIGDTHDKNKKLKSVYESSLGNYQIKLSTAKLTIRKYPYLMKKYGHLLYEGKSIYLKYEKNLLLLEKYKKLTDGGTKHFQKNSLKILENSKHAKKIKYYTGIINSPVWNKRLEAKQKKAIQTIAWAKRRLDYHTKHYDKEFDKSTNNAQKEYDKALKKLAYHQELNNKLSSKAYKDTALINKLFTDSEFGAEVGGRYFLSMYEEALKKGYRGFEAYWRSVGRYNGGWNNRNYYFGYWKTKTVNGKVKKYYINGVRDQMKIVKKLIKKGEIKTNV